MAVKQNIYHVLGGENRLKAQYPTIHRMISQAKPLPQRGSQQRQALWQGEGIEALNVCVCLEPKIDNTENLCVFLRSNHVQETEVLLYTITVSDHETGKLYDSSSGYAQNVSYFESPQMELSALVRANLHRPLNITVNYTWLENGESVTETLSEVYQATVGDDMAISGIDVNDPRSDKGNSIVLITYNRTSEDADYSYTDVVVDDYVHIRIPFDGAIQVTDNYEILEVCEYSAVEPSQKTELYFSVSKSFNVSYCDGDLDKLMEIFSISEDGKTLSWTIPDANWNVALSKSVFNREASAWIYCSIILRLKNCLFPTAEVYLPVVLYSTPADGEVIDLSNDSKEIPQIHLFWGCFAANTPVQMGDGSIMDIQNIRVGDTVKTAQGIARVSDTCQGLEKTMICIETIKGHQILVTETHPVLTERGLLPANELNAADLIVTTDGSWELAQLHQEPYHGTVYNLGLEGGDLLIADGIYAGDMVAQNTRAAIVQSARPMTQLQKELAELFGTENLN